VERGREMEKSEMQRVVRMREGREGVERGREMEKSEMQRVVEKGTLVQRAWGGGGKVAGKTKKE